MMVVTTNLRLAVRRLLSLRLQSERRFWLKLPACPILKFQIVQ